MPGCAGKACSPYDEMAKAIDVHPQTVKERAARGQLASMAYNDKNQRLYMPPQPTTTIPCARCGTSIPERGAQGQRQKYCGVSCRTGAYADAKAGRWLETGQEPPVKYAQALRLPIKPTLEVQCENKPLSRGR